MGKYHMVKQGEHLSGIATRYGYTRNAKIWDHPENADLKALRKNENVLFPGDSLFIPEREEKVYDRATEKKHDFVLKGDRLSLFVKLEKAYAQPMANVDCTLIVTLQQYDLKTDGNGLVGHQIPKTATDGTLFLKDAFQVKEVKVPVEREVDLRIGYLDPVDETSGQIARLSNLGYYRAAADEIDKAELDSAIEEFQCDQGLTVDGVCGPQTQAKLERVHGC